MRVARAAPGQTEPLTVNRLAANVVRVRETSQIQCHVTDGARRAMTHLIMTVAREDSGLLAALLGATAQRITADRSIFGPLLETFVISEIMKQLGWLDDSCTLTHYRDKDKNEVDFVIENGAGDLASPGAPA